RGHLMPHFVGRRVAVQGLRNLRTRPHRGRRAVERVDQVDTKDESDQERGRADRDGDAGPDERVVLHRDGEGRASDGRAGRHGIAHRAPRTRGEEAPTVSVTGRGVNGRATAGGPVPPDELPSCTGPTPLPPGPPAPVPRWPSLDPRLP